MKHIYRLVLLVALLLTGTMLEAASPTAAQILQKSSSALLKSGGISASYTYKSGNYTESGTLSAKGKMFSLISPQRSIWYDGKSLWTLNPDEKEVTLSAPTAAEASSLNPYMLVSNYKTEYTAKLVTGTIKGTYNILLIPVNKSNMVKSATICIRSSNYMPVRLDVTDRSNNKASIIVTNVRTAQKFNNSTFVYNAKAHPGVKLIDLR
ncbi:MAG: outer-membrane lipoprotein carrier protein LolA [Prevotella sp.]|nr:outer-membrane lipoprotein carrier protein LolA [Prevotella sp.]MCM1075120.1 outer-membrane lipoprotein carrier protein LolA [Ruminococcus sp.]